MVEALINKFTSISINPVGDVQSNEVRTVDGRPVEKCWTGTNSDKADNGANSAGHSSTGQRP